MYKKGILLFLIMMTISACNSVEAEKSFFFQTIEKKSDGAYIGQQQYMSLQPGIIVINSLEEVESNSLWFSHHAQEFLKKINYKNQISVAVFMGWQFTDGYKIEIEKIVKQKDQIQVFVKMAAPDSFQKVKPIVTSPYHLVWIRKDQELSNNLTYNLFSEGEIVASYPP